MLGTPAQAAAKPSNAPTLPIEQRYFAAGPSAVTMVRDFGLVNGSADVLISPSRQALPALLVGLQRG